MADDLPLRGWVMTHADGLRDGRDAFAAHKWSAACAHLEAVDKQEPLVLGDLERLAISRYLIGRELDSVDTWSRAFRVARDRNEPILAARCGFWAGFVLLNRGDLPAGNGWIARVQRMLAGAEADTVEAGYLGYLIAMRTIFGGDDREACANFGEVAQVGARFDDRDLETLARVGQGRALIRLGRHDEGVACLDEAMIAVTSGEVSPVLVGDSYCTVIEGCQEVYDLHRAQRWTEGLSRWCTKDPDLVAFRGQCLIHRAEILQLRGSWPDALSEVDRALERLTRPAGQLAVGSAYYQQGELHRLCGEPAQAETAYREAGRLGRQPQPGLALLRLADGNVADAEAAIRRVLAETVDPSARSRLLPAAVEVLVAAGDLDGASEAAREIEATAARYRSRLLHAVATQAQGTVRLAAGEQEGSLPSLRDALEQWHALEVPYEAARVRVLVGQACLAMGDEEGARSEWTTARDVFADLGARPDLERLDHLVAGRPDRDPHGLSERELEVLRHVASGLSNRDIADALVISHRTVERHLSNIFRKLGRSSRAAVTAYAYEHRLV